MNFRFGTLVADRVEISGLRANCVIGVDESERLAPQPVEIDIALEVDLAAVGASDDIADAVDYRSLAEAVVAAVESSSYLLIEALATRVAEECLADNKVEAVVVTIRKPGALPMADYAAVTIRRTRPLE